MELLIVLLIGVFCGLRYGATAAVAAAKGPEAWIEARREAEQLRHKRAMNRAARGIPTAGEAMSQWVAGWFGRDRKTRQRKTQGPLRRFLSEWWTDTWDAAGEQRHRHGERKRAGDLPRQKAAKAAQAAAARGVRWVRERATGRRPEPWQARRLDRDEEPVQGAPSQPVDAEWTDIDDAAQPPTETPARPAPATSAWTTVTPIRKDQPMTTANAEITSPEGALAFAEGVKEDAARLLGQIETATSALARLEVTGGPVDAFAGMTDPLRQLDGKAEEAAAYFRQHITTADHVRSDASFGNKQYATGS